MPKSDGKDSPGGDGAGMGGSRKGRMGDPRAGGGPDGRCICPQCGTAILHKAGIPCNH